MSNPMEIEGAFTIDQISIYKLNCQEGKCIFKLVYIQKDFWNQTIDCQLNVSEMMKNSCRIWMDEKRIVLRIWWMSI